MQKTFLFQLFILFVVSCSNSYENMNLKPYYFPYQDFFEAKVYKYSDKNADFVLYWHLKTEIVDNDTLFITKAYDKELNQIEFFTERISSKGSIMNEFIVFEETKAILTKRNDTIVYKWYLSEEKEIVWSTEHQSKYGKENISKSRCFISTVNDKEFSGNKYKTIKFKDTFSINVESNGRSDHIEYFQYSYYSKGLGMIGYKRFLPDKRIIEYSLQEILSEKQWNEIIKQ